MAETTPIPAKEIQTGIPAEAHIAWDAYEWFWASEEGKLVQAAVKGKPQESEPALGGAYEEFLGS